MNERQLFESALEIADPQARQAFLDQACQGDGDLRAKVDALLNSHATAGSFLDIPAADQLGPGADNSTTNTFVGAPVDDSEAERASGEAEFHKYLQPATRTGWLGRLGHYEIEAILGRGAFGIVAKAFDEKLHRVVAIKLMNPELAATSPPRKRFLREARTAAAVTHENIVAIHAVEEEPIPYLVMEYIPGLTLQQRMDEHGPLDVSEILRIGQQVAAGLAAAHAANLIHRDIKPSNILLTGGPAERAKISDFGLARAVDDATLTSSGLIAGTPMYMAPEQARGETLDHRADLFSLGSVLYQMASGRPPFRAANTVAVLKRVCEDAPRPLDDVIPGIPGWLETIVFRLLEKDRDDRYQTAQEVAALLARCQSELQHQGRVTCVPGRPAAAETQVLPARTGNRAASGRWPIGWLTGGAVGLVLLGVIAVLITNRNGTQPKITDQVSRAASAPGEAESTDSTNPDRRAAEWVLSMGGTVTIDDGQRRPVSAIHDLPSGSYKVHGINLYGKPLVPADLKKLNGLVNLSSLDLGDSKVGDAVIKELSGLTSLRWLAVPGSQMTDSGLRELTGLTNIEQVAFQNTDVTDAGLIHFKAWKNLSSLGLNDTQVGDEGIAHLVDCKNLRALHLHNTFVSDKGLVLLAGCPKLEALKVNNTRVTEAGVKKLSASLPGCKIEWDGGVIEPRTGWHGWPSDAPPPAIAPFDAEQAKQHQAAWAKYLGVPVEYTNSIGMKFRLIPPGEFTMGSTPAQIAEALNYDDPNDKIWHACVKSESPQHKVILTRPIYVGVHEVTQAEYVKVSGHNPSHFSATGGGKDVLANIDAQSHPVETVSWNDAAEFCAKLSQHEKFKPFYFRSGETVTPLSGTGYRLPTEAELEFACRSGTTTKYWLGDNDEELKTAAWILANSAGRTHAVGDLKPNPFGLFDVHGNVWEWVQDGWDQTNYAQFSVKPAVDPAGPSPVEPLRILRGGVWLHPASPCYSSSRHAYLQSGRLHLFGFRVSLPVDAVRRALKVDGPKIVTPEAPVGANGHPVAEQGRSAWDDLDPAQIPEAERVPRQPEGLIAVLGQHRRRVWSEPRSSSVSPDGTQFLLTTDDGLYLFGRDLKQPERFFNLGLKHPSATFLPDGRIAAFVHDGVIGHQLQIFAKPHDGVSLEKQTTTTSQNGEGVYHATASSDGRWVAGFVVPGSIGIWRLGDAPPQRSAKFVIRATDGYVPPFNFSPDGKWFSFTDTSQGQGTIHLIDLRGDTPREATVLKADADEKSDAPAKGFEQGTFLSDGRLATADRNGRIWFWNINDGEPQRVGSIRDTGVITAASQSLRLVVRPSHTTLKVWDVATDPPQLIGSSSSSFPADNIHTLAIAPNGETIFTGHLNGAVRFWNVSKSGLAEIDPLLPNPRYTNVYTQHVKVVDRFLCSTSESARVGIWWPTRDGLQPLPEQSASASASVLAASTKQRQFVVRESFQGGGTALLRCDADRITPTRRVSGDSAQSAALNDDGHRLAIGRHNGTDMVLELWGWESDDLPARKLAEAKSSPHVPIQLAFADAGRAVIGRVGLGIQIWDVKDDELISRVALPPFGGFQTATYQQFAVSPDGLTVATVASNGLGLWNLKSDLTQPTTRFETSGFSAVAFSPDGRRLAASFWENGASAGVQIINLATGVVEKRLTFPGRVSELTFTDDGRHLITGNANATIYVVRLQGPPTK